jgi:hypothetical protein
MNARNGGGLVQVVADALERIEHRVARIANLSHLNAMLAVADTDFVLPSPSLTLLALDPQHSGKIAAETEFRAPGANVATGEVTFSAISRESMAYPWTVLECSWAPALAFGDGSGALAERLELRLGRAPDLRSAPGWLSVAVEGGAFLAWGLAGAVVTWNAQRVRIRRISEQLTAESDTVPVQRWGLRQALDVLGECVLLLEITREMALETELTLSVRFEQPVPYSETPQAWCNALLVWNSLQHTYPGPTSVEQAVTGLRQQLIHPLETESLGAGWQAWAVTSVGPVGRPERLSRQRPGVRRESPEYRVVFTPQSYEGRGSDRPTLAVMLSPHSQRSLALLDQRLGVRFLATQGAAANGLPAGTRCYLRSVQTSDLQASGATMLVGSWGGTDGLTPDAWLDTKADSLRAFIPDELPRRVQDLERALAARYGEELELVDAWDLLRTTFSGEFSPLCVRVRFLRGERSTAERRSILRAAQRFVGLYLGPEPAARVRLQDVDAEAGVLR